MYQSGTDTNNNPILSSRTVWNSPDKELARKLVPQIRAEKQRILPELNQRNAYARELDKAEEVLKKAQNEILVGTQKESAAASRIRASLRGYKVLKVVGISASIFFIVDASIRSVVLLDGRHPGDLPIIPMSKITESAVRELLN